MPRLDDNLSTGGSSAGSAVRLRVLVASLVGVAALAGVGTMGHADPVIVAAAAIVVLGLGILLAIGARPRLLRPAAQPVVAAAITGLREEAETYALALELAPNPALIVSGGEIDDVAGRRVLFANAEARELLRIAREGALLVTAMRNPAVLEAIDESLFGGGARVLSYEGGGPQERFWRVWTKPLPPTSRHERLALVIMRDETDMRMNERMRADFLANASHELRTPLASLSGFIETLRGHAKDDEGARDRFLAIMSRQAERMARLIDDLLSLSRIELNEHIRPSGRCDIRLAASDVVDALAPQIEAKGVKVEITPGARGEAVVSGDRDQLLQVVQNLLDNAIKYAPQGSTVGVEIRSGLSLEAAVAPHPEEGRVTAPDGGRMSLLTPARATGGRYALVRVTDHGCGLAREHLPRLTERFYRVEGQNSSIRTGTGLGLAIVKHIINRHRGGFFVESAPDKGSAFCVYLPMAEATEAQAPKPRSETAAA
jgi:two-component system phosphate regulon sensor histidine kinase PhoR